MRARTLATILGVLVASPALPPTAAGLVLGAPGEPFGQQADLAGGLAGHAELAATPSGALALRVDGSWLLYGSETVHVPIARRRAASAAT